MTASEDRELPRGTVAIVGPGRVGTVLAAGLARAGHRVVAAGGGGESSRERFAERFAGARTTPDPTEAARDADLVVLAPPDDHLEEVADRLAAADALREGQRVVHVSGRAGLAALRRVRLSGARAAACHPAQTVPDPGADPEVLDGAAWAVTADRTDRGWAHDLVWQLGGSPHDVDEDDRVTYHAALTIGSNAVAAAVAVARRLLLAARVDDPAAFLSPLVRTSAANVLDAGAEAITGPVRRGDVGTIRAHIDGLDRDAPGLAAAYRLLSRAILTQVGPALDDDRRRAVRDALGGGDAAR